MPSQRVQQQRPTAQAIPKSQPPVLAQPSLASATPAPAAPVRAWNFGSISVYSPNRPKLPLQRKLSVGLANSPLEHDADRTAGQVMRMPESPKATRLNRKSAPAKASQAASPAAPVLTDAPPIVHDVLSSPGQPLDAATRSFMEPRFGRDFGAVRVHNDTAGNASAQAVNALAYTVGEQIVFAGGHYSAHTNDGRSLLAHELAHVVQQTDGNSPQVVSRNPGDPRHERGAEGETKTGFEIYRAEDGWTIIEGPSGSSAAGHGTTRPGFDVVAYNTRSGQLEINDNKSNKADGDVYSATAIDPARNLAQNLQALRARVAASQDVPGRIKILELVDQTIAAQAAGAPIPANVHLVVTGLGGNKTGVSGPLASRGVEFKEPIPDAVRVAFMKFREVHERLRNKVNLYESEHKAQLALIESPDVSLSSVAGYWTNKLHNSTPPPTAIWADVAGALARTEGALRRMDLWNTYLGLDREEAALLKAMEQYLTWKDGIEKAGEETTKTIAEVALASVGAFVTPAAIAWAAAALPAAIAGGTAAAPAASTLAATEQATIGVRVATQALRVAIASVDAAVAEEEFVEAAEEVEEAVEELEEAVKVAKAL